ncbi:phosphotransferase family protein [Patulibacter sp. S7RM1-6]
MSGTGTVTHLDVDALGRWLADRGLLDAVEDARPIGDGHSNVTLLVSGGGRRVVVRTPPPPPTPPGAHDVLREARVLAALAGTDVPVAGVLAVAEAGEVADVPLYVMDHVEGVVVTDETPLPAADESGRRRVGEAVVDALAALHAVDWRARGLEGFGRAEGYLERQLRRLGGLVAGGEPPAGFEELGAWLADTRPDSSPATIVHGDFRIGNLMLRPADERPVAAILDWELATIGDPLADLGYLVATWAAPGAPEHPLTRLGPATREPGYPTPDELAARYADATGRDTASLSWYAAFALWRLATLYEYSHRRYASGSGDPYYADRGLVHEFVAAGRRTAGLGASS